MTGGSRERAGRKPVRIDLTELEKLCALQCTNDEIAAWFGVSPLPATSSMHQKVLALFTCAAV
jgi:hypothetical protein